MTTSSVLRRLARRALATSAVAVALVALAGCGSSDDGASPSTTRPVLTMATTPPDATRLGVCRSFTTEQMQDLLGSAKVAPALPQSLKDPGGVTGEACSWQRQDADGGTRTVRIEARDYGADTATLDARFQALKDATPGATDLPGAGDAAFTASSDETSVVQVRTGPYLLTATSRGTGGLAPLTAAELGVLLGSTFEKLP